MKKILVTGKNGYVATSLKNWLERDKYKVDLISVKDNLWKESSFSEYDVVIHAAGLAHIKETKKNSELYYKINRDLAFEVAKKSKSDGVKQFIFLSSMSVYGMNSGVINHSSSLKPNTNYGKSKLQAEELISRLSCEEFIVAIIRPPMIYGNGCKGNYTRLSKLAVKTPIFPNIKNQRSMIYIDNFSEFIKLIINNYSYGIYFPQNKEYVSTSEMVGLISANHGKNIKFTSFFNPLIKLLKLSVVSKMFGSLVYEKQLSEHADCYQVYNFVSSIEEIEKTRF